MDIATILWRRLDLPGHDACRLLQRANGWRLEGTAVFLQNGEPASLAYAVDCDRAWRSEQGCIQGWVGVSAIEQQVTRTPDGIWLLNGEVAPNLQGCVDLDLGFTPATNLFQLRRMALQIGEGANVPVAWLDVQSGTLERLHQRYERRDEKVYWYEAPRFEYSGNLQVNAVGFVTKYPQLWEAETGERMNP